MQESSRLITRSEWEKLHAAPKDAVSTHADGSARSIKITRGGRASNNAVENANGTLMFRKVSVPRLNEALRKSMISGKPVRVVAHEVQAGTFFDCSDMWVSSETRTAFIMTREAAEGKSPPLLPNTTLIVPNMMVRTVPQHQLQEIQQQPQQQQEQPQQPQQQQPQEIREIQEIQEPQRQQENTKKRSRSESNDAVEDAAKRPRHTNGSNTSSNTSSNIPQALSTRVNGVTYRSRLEARFSIFLKALSVENEYERHTFVMNNGQRYTPDFYLPGQKLYVELKPAYPYAEEMARCRELCMRGISCALVFGSQFTPPFDAEPEHGRKPYAHKEALRGMTWTKAGRRAAGDMAWLLENNNETPTLRAVELPEEMSAASHASLKSAYAAAAAALFS
jgi:hypothetical protein